MGFGGSTTQNKHAESGLRSIKYRIWYLNLKIFINNLRQSGSEACTAEYFPLTQGTAGIHTQDYGSSMYKSALYLTEEQDLPLAAFLEHLLHRSDSTWRTRLTEQKASGSQVHSTEYDHFFLYIHSIWQNSSRGIPQLHLHRKVSPAKPGHGCLRRPSALTGGDPHPHSGLEQMPQERREPWSAALPPGWPQGSGLSSSTVQAGLTQPRGPGSTAGAQPEDLPRIHLTTCTPGMYWPSRLQNEGTHGRVKVRGTFVWIIPFV